MSETLQNLCVLCGKQYSTDAFSVRKSDFSVGREIRFVQGNRKLSGRLGVIERPWMEWTMPNMYIVRDTTTNISYPTRHDHMMFNDRIESDIHYRELYEHRLLADKYEYPPMSFSVKDAETPERRAEIKANAMHESERQLEGRQRFYYGFDAIALSVRRERMRQNLKFTKTTFGAQFNGIHKWLTILGEEVGEVDQAVLDHESGKDTIEHIRTELVQVAAVAFAIIERIDAKGEELFK